ncbi:MAG: hypothetical protein Q9159_002261 [Coniocarpon cinnabarinum]
MVAKSQLKHVNGVLLVPQPSDDPKDPLTWPIWRKCLTLLVVSFNAGVNLMSAFCFTSGVVLQAKFSANVAGLMLAPFFLTPLSRVLGINTTFFWSTLCLLGINVLSAEMSDRGDYTKFVVSRGLAGFFATIPHVLGNAVIVNVFYLHQRGRAFSFFAFCWLFGGIMGQSLGGFIIQHTKWTVEFWYTIGERARVEFICYLYLQRSLALYESDMMLTAPWSPPASRKYDTNLFTAPLGIALLCTVCLLEDTTFNRNGLVNKSTERSWISTRLATLFAGSENVPRADGSTLLRKTCAPFLILFSPVTIMAGLFGAIFFGWFSVISNLISIFLEEPWAPRKGLHGYGFSYQQTSAFTMSIWIGALAVQPVALNYVVESFERNPEEVGLCMNVWRLAFALAIPFFLQPWEAAVGLGWVFGISAFISVFAFGLMLSLMVVGRKLRLWSIGNTGATIEEVLEEKVISVESA